MTLTIGRPRVAALEELGIGDVGEITVDVDYEAAQRGSPTRFTMEVQLPKELPEEQRERLMQIACKCPVHRVLEGEVMFEETVELV